MFLYISVSVCVKIAMFLVARSPCFIIQYPAVLKFKTADEPGEAQLKEQLSGSGVGQPMPRCRNRTEAKSEMGSPIPSWRKPDFWGKNKSDKWFNLTMVYGRYNELVHGGY